MLLFAMRKIIFYTTAANRVPVQDFLDNLSAKQAKKVAWVLRLVREIEFVPARYFKKLDGTDDIWEVRINYGNNTFRLLGFWDEGNLVVLTNGFAKKTDKIPKEEINVAQERKADYTKRRKNNG
jgi:phage-related protein